MQLVEQENFEDADNLSADIEAYRDEIAKINLEIMVADNFRVFSNIFRVPHRSGLT